VAKRILAVGAMLILVGCGGAETQPDEIPVYVTDTRSRDLLSLLEESAELSLFRHALDEAGMSEVLAEPGPFTVFAPKDAAFQRLVDADTSEVMSRDSLRALISLHIVRGRLEPRAAPDSLWVSTLLEVPVLLRYPGGGRSPIVGTHRAQTAIEGMNGVVYPLPGILSPPEVDTTAHNPWLFEYSTR
jgi:uncharacterized surface protein with fasciclin (FAS1) repeats